MKITKQTTDETVLAELGGRLTRIRLERNLTQLQLAKEAGVSKNTVQRLEAGAVATQLSGFIRVCRVLDVIERLDHGRGVNAGEDMGEGTLVVIHE